MFLVFRYFLSAFLCFSSWGGRTAPDPPRSSPKIFVEILLTNPFLESVCYVPRPYEVPHREWGPPRPLSVFILRPLKKFRKQSSNFSLIKIINLCTPPYELPPVMRIPMLNPIGGGEHCDHLLFLWPAGVRCALRCAPRTSRMPWVLRFDFFFW